MTDLAEARAELLPSRGAIEAQKKLVELALEKLNLLESRKSRKAARIEQLKADLFRRLTTIQEREQVKRVAWVRGRLSKEYRPPA